MREYGQINRREIFPTHMNYFNTVEKQSVTFEILNVICGEFSQPGCTHFVWPSGENMLIHQVLLLDLWPCMWIRYAVFPQQASWIKWNLFTRVDYSRKLYLRLILKRMWKLLILSLFVFTGDISLKRTEVLSLLIFYSGETTFSFWIREKRGLFWLLFHKPFYSQ